ncbi:unnamed protein product [Lepeophtheirus salmonis]|uniref:(salmon louse) hypothetical protein n=1 Tax=Lepeophtheirus salmonis TaxID=72036 RepID=A0A7R8CTD1_LEPSM|nr:unnamed protein product [Lepeophtheirus salmonis]CAF2925124.1 unnamed protein product [Lepeophtheirus salmonis]
MEEMIDDLSLDDFEKETDEIYRLMQDLTSEDNEVSRKASNQIEKYVEERKRKRDEKELIDGCWTTSSRVVINEDGEEKRKKLSEEFRKLGNESFRSQDFVTAKEYYSSAILQYDQNPILFNNRAQTSLRLEDYGEVIKDTFHSIKLNPNIVKTYVILAKGLKGERAYNKALEVLLTLQKDINNLTDVEKKVVQDLENEIKEEMSNVENNIKKVKKT